MSFPNIDLDIRGIRLALEEHDKNTQELLNAILCKNSDVWKCIYYMHGVGVCGGDDFMLKMEIEGHTSYEEIEEIIKDKIKQKMKWDDDVISWGFINRNKTNTEFKFYADVCVNKRKYTYDFIITKTY